jgi:hypothetical protein
MGGFCRQRLRGPSQSNLFVKRVAPSPNQFFQDACGCKSVADQEGNVELKKVRTRACSGRGIANAVPRSGWNDVRWHQSPNQEPRVRPRHGRAARPGGLFGPTTDPVLASRAPTSAPQPTFPRVTLRMPLLMQSGTQKFIKRRGPCEVKT